MDPPRRSGGPVLLAFILLAVVVFLVCAGGVFPLQVTFTLAVGWVPYLGRVLPQLNPDPAAVATAVLCLLGVVFGGHAFLRWLYAATDPALSPEVGPRRWRWRWTLMLVGLVVLMFTSGIAITGTAHQTGWLLRSPEPLLTGGNREATARVVSVNHLKQLGLAAHNFHEVNSALPRSTFDPTGRPLHSWQTHLLPYVEEGTLFQQVDLSKPWTDPANAGPLGKEVRVFLNPSALPDRVNGFGVSHYAGNVNVVLGDTPRTLASFPQGISNTIFAGEVSANVRPWGDPLNARDPRLGLGHPHGFGAPNRPPQFAMLDGTVRTFDARELADLAGKVPE